MPTHVIPAPAICQRGEGGFDLARLTAFTVQHEHALAMAVQLRSDMQRWAGVELPAPVVADAGVGGLHLACTCAALVAAMPGTPAARGGHHISIGTGGITVSADTVEGLYRGGMTLVQSASISSVVPHAVIEDAAQFGWRGLSLDVVRHLLSLDEVRRVIDLLALYKCNVLHLHLTDNEAWRLQMQSWPTLSSGYEPYSMADFAALQQYASERFITVVPEIDLPGHCAAALRAYPELNPSFASAPPSPFPMATIDAQSPSAWQFVDDVMRELCAATVGSFVHVGGDEAFGMAPEDHAMFVRRAMDAVHACGKTPIGWQETSRGGVGTDDVVQYWIDLESLAALGNADADAAPALPAELLTLLAEHFGQAAGDPARIAAKGPRVIFSPNGHAYLDRPHGESSVDGRQEAARARLGLPFYPPTPLRAYLEWTPSLEGVAADAALGVEAALWCETVTSREDLELLLLPRLSAVAQVAWGSACDWDTYRSHIAQHAAMWERAGYAWYRTGAVEWSA